MNNYEINEIARNDQYTLGVLAEMDFYILHANLNYVSYEYRKEHIKQAIRTIINARFSIWARNSLMAELKTAATYFHWQNTVKEYHIEIDIKDLLIDFSEETLRKSIFGLISYSISESLNKRQ